MLCLGWSNIGTRNEPPQDLPSTHTLAKLERVGERMTSYASKNGSSDDLEPPLRSGRPSPRTGLRTMNPPTMLRILVLLRLMPSLSRISARPLFSRDVRLGIGQNEDTSSEVDSPEPGSQNGRPAAADRFPNSVKQKSNVA